MRTGTPARRTGTPAGRTGTMAGARAPDRGGVTLPPIPAKRYFTIGEVSELCGVKPHVLRYWEQEFTQLKPVKRRGNRRYYQHHEVLLIRRIRELLYEQGFTINGARSRLGEGAAEAHAAAVPAAIPAATSAASVTPRSSLNSTLLRGEIKSVVSLLRS